METTLAHWMGQPAAHSRRTPSRRQIIAGAGTAALLSLLPLGCNSQSVKQSAVPPGTPVVRVLLLEGKSQVQLSATEVPSVRVGSGTERSLDLPRGANVPVVCTAAGWHVGNTAFGTGDLLVIPAGDGSVSVDGHAFHGRYRFVARPGNKFDVINDVDVDGYVKGVLAKEMFSSWHDAAYRAQAIVARTYALYVARTTSPSQRYDLFADVRSQVYGGIAAESAKSRAAVDATRGTVVAYGPAGQERIFKAYFSACCGGVAQNAAYAFGDPPIEPLAERNVGPRCTESPKFSWPTVSMNKSEITRRLRVWGAHNNAPEATIGNVNRIDVLSANRFGRPASFRITDQRGYQYSLNCEDLRLALCTDATDGVKLPSSFFRPVNDPAAIRFTEGHGLGHGVGMCQYCAEHQAVAGVSHEQIVLQAFPKAVLVQAY